MRKIVLFVLAIGFAFSSIAQNQMVKKKDVKRLLDGPQTAVLQNHPTPMLNTKATNEDVNRIEIGTCAHQRPFRRDEARAIAYNPDLNLISVTFVLDPATYPEAADLGIVGQFYSTDHGQTWTGPVIVADDISNGANYYTSGSIYNPEGNTNVDDAIGVYQGTIVPNTGDWRFSMFGNSDYTGDNLVNYSYEETDADYSMHGYFNWQGLQQVGNEMRCINVYPLGAWNAFDAFSLESIRAEFDGTEFDWTNSTMVDFDLYYDETNTIVTWIGNWQGHDNGMDLAWSEDGETGYMWIVGVSNDDPSGYQPIVYRTEDGGVSWDYIFLDFQDQAVLDVMYEHLIDANGTSTVIPSIFESTGVVNVQGDLELITAVGSHSADIFNYPDSLGYSWQYPGDIFNITVDAGGIKDVIWVDSLNTQNVVAATEGNYAGNGWQHRLYATKSPDGQEMMFTWGDTRDAENNDYNISPDLFGWAKAVTPAGDVYTMDEDVCFTEGTLYETFYYFTSGADYAYVNETGGYTVPYTQTITPGEFATNTSATADPVTVSYVTGIEFPNLIPVGLDEGLANASGIEVTQNQPNPFTGTTTIEISSNTVATAMIEVSNIMGQTVYTMDAGTINGTKKVTLNASDLEAGVYFYTVTVGNESISKKMIVE